jgi:murein DD-endopeptidase MepM/ murein hydrolase activator NlpD
MKRRIVFLLGLLLSVFHAVAQPALVKIFTEANHPNGYDIFASNAEWYPVSVRIEWKNTNLLLSENGKTEFLIPPKQEHYKLGDLLPEQTGKTYKLSYRFFTAMGDVHAKHDANAEYDLPYGKGAGFVLYQGYNGSFSHQGEYALDFTMPEGTPLYAVRGGTVVQSVQSNTRQCADPSCKQFNNFITILHSDGTFANYAHLKPAGAAVNIGDSVRTGQLIAYSGNTGYTSGPHFHLEIFTGSYESWRSLPTKFRVKDGSESQQLREGQTYPRSY